MLVVRSPRVRQWPSCAMGSLAGMALRLTDGLEQEAGAGVLEATLYLREAVQGQQRNSWIILSNYSITQTVLSHIMEG